MLLNGDLNVLVYADRDEPEQRANRLCLARTPPGAKSMRLPNSTNVSGFVMCLKSVSSRSQSMMETRKDSVGQADTLLPLGVLFILSRVDPRGGKAATGGLLVSCVSRSSTVRTALPVSARGAEVFEGVIKPVGVITMVTVCDVKLM
jgi:hypothetical protein